MNCCQHRTITHINSELCSSVGVTRIRRKDRIELINEMCNCRLEFTGTSLISELVNWRRGLLCERVGCGGGGEGEGIEEKDVDHGMTCLQPDKLSFHRSLTNYL